MRINSREFLLLLGFMTLALAALTLWLWPRLAGRGVRPISGRIALLLGTQLSLAATFLFTINALGGFYTSWGQLFGTSSSQYALKDRGAAPANNAQQLTLAGGGAGQIHGLRSALDARLQVFTPADYAGGAGAKKDFPVEVVDLTGGGSAAGTAPGTGPGGGLGSGPDYQQVADQYQVLIVVVADVDGTVIPGVNVPGGPLGEQFWAQDLRTAIGSHYRVTDDPALWGIAGADQSGCAAINLAVQDSTRYGAAAATGNWTSGPDTNSWPGIDRYLTGVPLPAVHLLYDSSASNIPSKIQKGQGPFKVTTQPGLDLSAAVTWLGQTLQADAAAAPPAPPSSPATPSASASAASDGAAA